MLFNVQRFFLEGHGRTRPAMIVGLLGLILNIPLNIILVFGICVFPAMGAAGCGMATAILYCFMAAAMIWFVQKTDRSALAIVYPRWDIFKRLVRIGTPGAFAILNETAAFALIALMVAPLGVTAVAGHQIAINVSGFIWMCPFSIGAAATIRISVFLGSSRISAARYARLVSLSITLGMAVILAIFTALLRYHVATLYNDDPAVIQMAALLLICEVLYQFPDGIQTNTVCALRGWNDTRAIFWISFLAYWVVSLPLGWTLCMTEILTPEPLGVLGFWISLLFSLSLAAILYLIRIHHLEHLPLETIKKKIDK
jgi:MATE family multidrug resistance protein